MRVAFFGNSQSIFSNRHFKALMDTSCELLCVVDVPVSKRNSTNPAKMNFPDFIGVAHQQGIPVFEPDSPNQKDFVEAIGNLSPDFFIVVGYTNILKEQILSIPRIMAVNFHASLLPAYRGKHPVFWALRNGEKWAGLTIHVMDIGLDNGDILYQVKVRTRRDDSVATLYDRIMPQSVKLVDRLINDAKNNGLQRTPQSEEGASYYSSVHEDDFGLDWSKDAEMLARWIHTSPNQCFCKIKKHKVFFMDVRVIKDVSDMIPSILIRVGRNSCTVTTGKGLLRLYKGQIDNDCIEPMPDICQKLGLRQGELLH